MTHLQQTIVLCFGLLNVVICLKGFYETWYRHNAFGSVLPLSIIGIFVWGDAVIIGLFWTLAALAGLVLNDLYLFVLIMSLFWVVRSLGETVYWLNQQFSTINRNPEEDSVLYPLFQNQAVWFGHQLIWQGVTVLAAVASIYFGAMWLRSF